MVEIEIKEDLNKLFNTDNKGKKFYSYIRKIKTSYEVDEESKNEFKSFFEELRECDIVVACPSAFFIVGEHSVLANQLAVYMPIPIYIYVGIKRGKNISIKSWVRKLKERYIHNETETTFKLEKLSEENIIYLTKVLKEIAKNKNFRELEIDDVEVYILSEIPLCCGLNSSGALSSALSLALYAISFEHAFLYTMEDWKKLKLMELLQKEEFNQIFKLAQEIDRLIQGDSSGVGPFASLVGSKESYPIIYLRYLPEKNDDCKVRYYAWYLNEIYNSISVESVFRHLYALIYSGKESNTKTILEEEIKKRLNTLTTGILNFAEKVYDVIPDKRTDKGISKCADTPLEKILNRLKDDKEGCEIIDNTMLYLDKKINKVFLGGCSLALLGACSVNNWDIYISK